VGEPREVEHELSLEFEHELSLEPELENEL
jgi:hypothetical protein